MKFYLFICLLLISKILLIAIIRKKNTRYKIDRNNVLLNKYVFFNCTKPNLIALTFDDGPNDNTKLHLDFLKSKNIKATFFLIANKLRNQTLSDYAKNALNDGHQIANHNFFHYSMNEEFEKENNTDRLLIQIYNSTNIFEKELGIAPIFYRPPYGEIDVPVAKLLDNLGFKISLWNLDSKDWYWEGKGIEEKLNIVNAFKSSFNYGFEDNFISLLHEKTNNPEAEYERLDHIIDLINFKGLKTVTMSECLGGINSYFDNDKIPSREFIIEKIKETVNEYKISKSIYENKNN